MAEVLALAHSRLKLPDHLRVQRRSARDGHFNLTTRRAHQGTELLANALKNAQAVVLGQCLQEVLDRVVLVCHTHGLLQLLHNLRLVGRGEGRRGHDGLELAVLLEGAVEVLEALGDIVEGTLLSGGGVLPSQLISIDPLSRSAAIALSHTRALA